MEVVVDGKTGLVTPDAGTTLQAVFEALRRTVASRRRVIVSFTLDGELLTAERQGVLGDHAPGTYSLLEVRTADPFQLSLGTLTGLLGHLKNMERTHDEAIAFSASSEYIKTLEKADAVFHGWDILLRAVRDVGFLSTADFKNLDAEGATIDARMREMQDLLMRFSAALEFKDVARVSDMIEKDFRPKLSPWRGVMETLGRHIARFSGISSQA